VGKRFVSFSCFVLALAAPAWAVQNAAGQTATERVEVTKPSTAKATITLTTPDAATANVTVKTPPLPETKPAPVAVAPRPAPPPPVVKSAAKPKQTARASRNTRSRHKKHVAVAKKRKMLPATDSAMPLLAGAGLFLLAGSVVSRRLSARLG
jgi:type IV secretory pathway VirB10-like protein